MAAPSDSLSAPFGRNFEGLDGSRVTDPAQSELQLSGIAEGFFVPAFFILLGAELDFRVLAGDPRAIMLAVVMGAAAIAIHVGAALLAAPTPRAVFGVAASAQLGLPAAAASPWSVNRPLVGRACRGSGCGRLHHRSSGLLRHTPARG
jgi:hypothetical protein